MKKIHFVLPFLLSKNDDSYMKIDKMTYLYRKENQINLPANHTSQRNIVLFFADIDSFV